MLTDLVLHWPIDSDLHRILPLGLQGRGVLRTGPGIVELAIDDALQPGGPLRVADQRLRGLKTVVSL